MFYIPKHRKQFFPELYFTFSKLDLNAPLFLQLSFNFKANKVLYFLRQKMWNSIEFHYLRPRIGSWIFKNEKDGLNLRIHNCRGWFKYGSLCGKQHPINYFHNHPQSILKQNLKVKLTQKFQNVFWIGSRVGGILFQI